MRGNVWGWGMKGAVVSIWMGLLIAAGAPAEGKDVKQSLALPGKTFAWTFQADTLGQKPAHSVAFGGNWQVLEDSTSMAPSSTAPPAVADSAAASAPPSLAAPARRFLTQSESDDGIAFHYLAFTRPTLEDLDASVRFRIRSGEIDPSAGLLFQMDRKGTSGYLVRVSGRTGQLSFHYLLYGKRRDVKFAKIGPLTPGAWHTLAVQRRKSLLRVLYDGKELITVRDDRFSRGTVGVWTEDDTLVDFSDLTATAR